MGGRGVCYLGQRPKYGCFFYMSPPLLRFFKTIFMQHIEHRYIYVKNLFLLKKNSILLANMQVSGLCNAVGPPSEAFNHYSGQTLQVWQKAELWFNKSTCSVQDPLYSTVPHPPPPMHTKVIFAQLEVWRQRRK